MTRTRSLRLLTAAFVLLQLLTLVAGCSRTPVASGTEDGNATALTGIVYDTLGEPAIGARITLVPADHDPRSQSGLQKTQTDTAGRYSFAQVPFGTYGIEGYDTATGTRFLHAAIVVAADTADCGADTSFAPGVAAIVSPFPGNACEALIMGTTQIRHFAAGTDTLIVDSLPAGILPGIVIVDDVSGILTTVGENVVIHPHDTLKVTTRALWKTIKSETNGDFNAIRVADIAADGSIWYGASTGLVQYDNTGAWSEFGVAASPVLGDFLRDVLVDDSGFVWAAGVLGLTRYRNGTFSNWIGTIPGSTDTAVEALDLDDSGHVWVAGSKSLASFDGISWHSHPVRNIVDMFAGSGDSVWCTTVQGVVLLVGSDTTRYTAANSQLPDDYVQGIDGDTQGNRWFATRGGLARRDGAGVWTVWSTANAPLPYDEIYKVRADGAGGVWLVCGRFDLIHFDGSKWTRYNSLNSILPANVWIENITIDAAGVKWIGLLGGGIIRFED